MNAMVGNCQTLGKMDSNIKGGVPVNEAVSDLVKAMYLKRFWIHLGGFKYWITPRVLVLSETLTSIYGKWYHKK